jgi:hypothetical protein
MAGTCSGGALVQVGAQPLDHAGANVLAELDDAAVEVSSDT